MRPRRAKLKLTMAMVETTLADLLTSMLSFCEYNPNVRTPDINHTYRPLSRCVSLIFSTYDMVTLPAYAARWQEVSQPQALYVVSYLLDIRYDYLTRHAVAQPYPN
ncbi:hypothetical protein DFH07DRAFT_448323 [Mycena maculata]|uniref:Uncharacterized protein n=1 Tax=Mycena maculata TaxID=230809 RepID=A0AAD7J7P1_9AGAR|nr:hypothetical protein DFH07DRAFT_448323 [Mycena maculata]